jgi:hypothetical protein
MMVEFMGVLVALFRVVQASGESVVAGVPRAMVPLLKRRVLI